MKLKHGVTGCLTWMLMAGTVSEAQKPPLLPENDVAALTNELSGETAKRNLEGIARFHRQRGSTGFHAAAELVAERLSAYGLTGVTILRFPADGKIFYGTQRSRPAWDAQAGELDVAAVESPELVRCKIPEHPEWFADCIGEKAIFHTSYEAQPIVLAEDSENAEIAMVEMVDVGEGTKESDYAEENVRGKIVLVSGQPDAVQELAVEKFGAVGIVSYAQNQKTAWSGENENLVRWGHLKTFSEKKTFAFMVSLKTAREFQGRLKKGETLHVHAKVKAGQHRGNYEVVTATIPGADPKLKDEEIAFSCHLDHQRPGANDNASGCVTILEVARTLKKLIDEKKLERPARTIRFVFPPEIEGTLALATTPASAFMFLSTDETKDSEVEIGRIFDGKPISHRFKAVIHMDMVGGGPETKAVFHVTRGPMSLPSFVHDVAWSFAEWVNEESYKFAATGSAEYPLVAPEGGKEPLRAEYSAYTMGSDHDVYQDSSFGIPAIYLNDWPDRYIHTNFDTAANIDTTKLKRAAFIGAASGYFLATMDQERARRTIEVVEAGQNYRAVETQRHSANFADEEAANMKISYLETEAKIIGSVPQLGESRITDGEIKFQSVYPLKVLNSNLKRKKNATADGLLKFGRKTTPKGQLVVFGYDYFADHARAAGMATPKLLTYQGLWGAGEEYAYEVLNFADGKRNAQDIRDAVAAEYGPVPLELVVEYLKALEKIGIVEKVN